MKNMVSFGEPIDLHEGCVFEASNVQIKINSRDIEGTGSLYCLQRALVFVLSSNNSITIPWALIGLHAIQNTTNGLRSIYFMIDSKITWKGVYSSVEHNNGTTDDDEGLDSGSEEGSMTEFWLKPESEDMVDHIFDSMKHCQTLHPDPADSVSEDEDYMEAEDPEDDANQIRNLHINDDKFADAEDQ